MNDYLNKIYSDESDITLKDLVASFRRSIAYLRSRSIIIMIASLVGGFIGTMYAFLRPYEYTSRMSFVLEESKSSGGGLASLAGQFGFDLGSIGSGGGFFSGDNIILFLKSERLIRETLFTPYGNDSSANLADKYAESMFLKKKWSNNEKIGLVKFKGYNWQQLPRIPDSLLQEITKDIIEDNLHVEKPDKKASFIEVKFNSRDELLSQYFVTRLVDIATQHYIESKIKLKTENLAKLQRKADSLIYILNSRTYRAAESQQGLVDINPGLKVNTVTAEITSRDKTVAATLYTEVVKNLEVSKTLLNQATPTIQIVDVSSLPLKIDKVNKVLALLIGLFVAAVLMIIYLLISRQIRSL